MSKRPGWQQIVCLRPPARSVGPVGATDYRKDGLDRGEDALGITGFLATLDVLATDLPGLRMLAADRREVPGEFENVQRVGEEFMGRPIFRYSYSFTLPEGTRLRGASYSQNPASLQKPKGLPNPPGSPGIVIEYILPPPLNRLKGTRTGAMPASLLPWFLISVPIAGAVVVAGLRRGLRRVRLLKSGSAAEATLTTFVFPFSQSRSRPFAAYCNRRESSARRATASPLMPRR